MKFVSLFIDNSVARRIYAWLVLVAFVFTGTGGPSHYAYAQQALTLPVPGTRMELSSAFEQPFLRGVKVYPDDPFRLDFILDKGDSKDSIEQLKSDSTRLIKYFLASVTVPENDLWVNLSPYEKDRIIPDAFGVTEMGRDLLAQDYVLKQITASVIYPEGEIGKAFWAKVYAEAQERYGTTDIPVDTFNKVWIVPEKAVIYEAKDAAYVTESRLKVMLESDYLAMEHNVVGADFMSAHERAEIPARGTDVKSATQEFAKDILREVVIPILEKEVNEGRNFAQLRQVYHSLILAIWFKDKIKESIFGKTYVDQKKTGGVDIEDKAAKDKIWARYVEGFKKGAYNYIKEEYDPVTQETVPRKYFSGGAWLAKVRDHIEVKDAAQNGLPESVAEHAMIIRSDLAMENALNPDIVSIDVLLHEAAVEVVEELQEMKYAGLGVDLNKNDVKTMKTTDITRDDLPFPEGANVVIFPSGSEGLKALSFWAAKGRFPGVNFLIVPVEGSLFYGQRHSDMVFVKNAAFFNNKGALVLGRFKDPVAAHALCLEESDETGNLAALDGRGIPVLNMLSAAAFVSDKVKVGGFLKELGVPTPEFEVMEGSFSDREIRERIQSFLEKLKIDTFVLKPNHGSSGDGVKMFSSGEMEDALKHTKKLLNQKKTVILQRRIVNRLWKDPVTGKHIDSNLRVFVSWDHGKPVINENMIMVRYGEMNGEPKNLSKGAKGMRLDQLFDALSLDQVTRARYFKEIVDQMEYVITRVEEKVRALDPKGLTSARHIGLSGWDLVYGDDGKWYVLEGNVGAVGALNDIESLAPDADKGKSLDPFGQYLSEISLAYQKEHREITTDILSTEAEFEMSDINRMIKLANRSLNYGDDKTAEYFAGRVLAADPDHVAALSITGVVLMHQRGRSEAELYFQHALDMDPDSVKTMECWGNTLLEQDQDVDAEVLFRRALKKDPKSAGVRANLGFLLIRQGKDAEAEEHLQQVLTMDARNLMAIYYMGLLKQKNGLVAEAEASFLMALEIDPWQARVLGSLAALELNQEDDLDAEKYYLKALEAGSRDIEVMNNLGVISGRKKNYSEAERYFKMALEIDPGFMLVRKNLVVLLRKQGKYFEAYKYLNKPFMKFLREKLFKPTLTFFKRQSDHAETGKYSFDQSTLDAGRRNTGGIDLTADKLPRTVQRFGDAVQFNFDSAMIDKLQNATGMTPVIIDIQPMTGTLRMFLGDSEQVAAEQLSMR
jgi:Tfp pilus assembly protein PilF